MKRNIKYRLLLAFLTIIIANNVVAETYYSKPGSNPSVYMLKGDGETYTLHSTSFTTPVYSNETAFNGFSYFGLAETECTNTTDGGTIGSAQTICSGTAPDELTQTAAPGGSPVGTLEYQWQSSTTSDEIGFEDIGSASSSTYQPGALNETTWYRRLARVDCMTDWSGAAESNVLEVTVIAPPTITDLLLDPPLDITKFTNYELSVNVVPNGNTINDVSFIVRPQTASATNLSWDFLTNGTPYPNPNMPLEETATNTAGNAWSFSKLRPDNIYSEIAFIFDITSAPSNSRFWQNSYQLMRFTNNYDITPNTSFFIEVYATPNDGSPPSADIQVYLVGSGFNLSDFETGGPLANEAWQTHDLVELVGTINRNEPFHHNHDPYSSHFLVPLSAGADGKIGNKKLDIKDDFWIILTTGHHLQNRGWDMKYHAGCDNNNTWYKGSGTNFALQGGCPDMHVHFAREETTPPYDGMEVRVAVEYEYNSQTCLLESVPEMYYFAELPNLPPNASAFTSPEPGTYQGDVTISWYPATDPNNDPLTYNIYLIDITGTPDTTSVVTGLTNTSYVLNTTLYPNADYDILVEACDAEFCTGFDWSSNIDEGGYFRILNDATWTGNTSSDWFTASNWSTNAVPSGSEIIIIPSTTMYPVISGTSPGNDVTLTATGTLSVEGGATLTLTAGPVLTFDPGSAVTTGDGARIIIEPDATYLNLSGSTPVLEVQRDFHESGGKGWRMMASPVAATYGDMFASPLVTQGFAGSMYEDLQPNLLSWDETDAGTTLQGWRLPAGATPMSDIIPAGAGYYYYIFNGAGRLNPDGSSSGANYPDLLPQTMTVTGVEPNIYAGSFTFNPLTFTPRTSPTEPSGPDDENFNESNPADEGWNMLGNPMASTLNWHAATGWTRNNIDNTIYVWDPSDNEFKYTNGEVGNFDGLIAPFQAFWVRANGSAPLLGFANDAKYPVSGTFLKKASSTSAMSISLSLSGGQMETTSFISFGGNGITGPDPWDAYRLEPPGNTWLKLFTLSSPAHASPLVVNNLPPLQQEEMINIPLFVGGQVDGEVMDGMYTLKWQLPDMWPAGYMISLHDNQSQKVIVMTENSQYTFSYKPSALKSAGSEDFALPGHILKRVSPGSTLKSSSHLKGSSQLPPFSIIIRNCSNCEEDEYVSLEPMLLPNYPNPFSQSTTIRFSLAGEAHVRINIYDLRGMLVASPANGVFPAGFTEINWQPVKRASSIYFIRFISGGKSETRKAVFMDY